LKEVAVSGFKETAQLAGGETTRASARLPGLEIEILHRRAPDDSEEQIAINLKAIPSFEAFGRLVGPSNPFAFWADLMRLAWAPWFEAARAMLPSSASPSRQQRLERDPRPEWHDD
jgi:hypothetical protein